MPRMDDVAFVYIMASGFKHLYIGVTTNLGKRVGEHKEFKHPTSFTARYNMTQLVYYERWESIGDAINREKQLKRWSRIKKMGLIVRENPDWKDLSLEWGEPIEPLSGPVRPPETFGGT